MINRSRNATITRISNQIRYIMAQKTAIEKGSRNNRQFLKYQEFDVKLNILKEIRRKQLYLITRDNQKIHSNFKNYIISYIPVEKS